MKEKSFNAIAWYLVCLALAVFTNLYYFLVINTSEELFISPLTIEVSEDFIFTENVPNTVEVGVRGVRSQLDRVTSLDFRTSINLMNVQNEGVIEAEVVLEKFGFLVQNDSFEISVNPAILNVTLERKTSKSVPIVPVFVDSIPRGYSLQGYRTTPAQVDLIGPRSELDTISEVFTEQISLASVLEDSNQTVGILNPTVFSSVSQENARIFFSVVATDSVRTYQNISVLPVGLSDELTYYEPLPSVTVVVQSSEEILETYTPFLFAEMQEVTTAGIYEAQVQAQDDQEVILISISPAVVQVSVGTKTGKGLYY